MEHNDHLIDAGFSALRDISATQINTLVNFDNLPDTPLEPSQMLVSSSHQIESSSLCTTNVHEEDVQDPNDCSILRFNNQPLPSQIESEIDFSVFNRPNDDANNVFSQAWSLSSGFVEQKSDNVAEKNEAPLISTQEIDEMLGDINEFPRVMAQSKPTENDLEFSQNVDTITDSVIITSPDIDHITLEDTELLEILDDVEFQEKSFTTNPMGFSQNINKIKNERISSELINFSQKHYDEKNSQEAGILSDFSFQATYNEDLNKDNSKFIKPKDIFDTSNKFKDVSSNAGNVTEFSTKSCYNSTKTINFSTTTSFSDDDDAMEPLDDIDFNQLNALEMAFSRRMNNNVIPRQVRKMTVIHIVTVSYINRYRIFQTRIFIIFDGSSRAR